MELEDASLPDRSNMEDDFHKMEKKKKQMMKFKEHIFKNAKENIDWAQTRYKQDYDRKRSATEVLYIIYVSQTAYVLFITLGPGGWYYGVVKK